MSRRMTRWRRCPTRCARLSPRSTGGGQSDAFSAIERRIASIADALQSRNRPGQDAHALDAMVRAAVRQDRAAAAHPRRPRMHDALRGRGGELCRQDRTAAAQPQPIRPRSGHLEDRIVRLVEKLDASDARLNHLEAIERGLARAPDPLRASAAPPARRARLPKPMRSSATSSAPRIRSKRCTERSAMWSTGSRPSRARIRDDRSCRRAANIPERAPAAAARCAGLALRAASADCRRPRHACTSGYAARAAVVAPCRPADRRSVPAAKPAAVAPLPDGPAATANPAPAAERRPIDPDLPPDHPLEPGAVRGRGTFSPAERIAASEAALGNVRPPVIPDPGGKSNFIAAARRAAQAAMVEAPPAKDKRAAPTSPPAASASSHNLAAGLGGKVRKLHGRRRPRSWSCSARCTS